MSKNVSFTQARSLLSKTYSRWSSHNAPRLGASVAFYSILSFAPLLVLMTGIIGLVFGNESAHGALVNEARQMIGNHGAETVDSLLKNAQKPTSGVVASILAFITLLLGASGVFTELQDALNIMWDAPKQENSGFLGMVRQRLFSFGMVLSIGFLLLALLVLSSGLAFIGQSFRQAVPLPPAVLEVLSFVFSIVVVTVLFALMFKYVPSVHVAWREVIVGAIGTALLFAVGKLILGIYLGKASVASTYGAAGSLVAVVIWIYYSAQIFFFGAEFTRVHADAQRAGHRQAAQPQPSGEPALVTPAPVQQPEERPKTMAAAASASTAPSLVQAPARSEPQVSMQPETIVAPSVQENTGNVVEALPAVAIPVRLAPHKITKPRLLAAVAAGFLLGRFTSSKRSGR